MPEDEKIEMMEEKIGIGENNVTLPDMDEIEKRIDSLSENIKKEKPTDIHEQISLLDQIFTFGVGDRIRNKLNESGIIEMVALDYRGVLYLVQYKEGVSRWQSDDQISKDASYQAYKDDSKKEGKIKTDIPQ